MSSDTLYKLETSQAHLIRDSEVLKGHESLAVHLILMTLIQEQLVLYTRFCEDPSAIHDWVTGEHVNLET